MCLKDLNIRLAFDDVKSLLMSDSPRKNLLQKLLRYVEHQWIMKSTVGPQRLSIRDNPSHTNNVLESFHSVLRSRVKFAHPNVFAFLAHLQRATSVDSQADVRRASRGMAIRRAKKKTNVVNDKRIKTCLQRYDTHAYTRLQFLQAVSHSISSYTDDMCGAADNISSFEIRIICCSGSGDKTCHKFTTKTAVSQK